MTPGTAVRHASVARHVKDCATLPSIRLIELSKYTRGESILGAERTS